MQAPQAILTFTDAERPLGDRLLKLAVEIDRIEGYSDPHAIGIARLSEKLGAMMGLHGSDLTSLKFAALAHDIGERQTKRNYLLRPDALTWEETLDLWRHPILGEQASAEIRLPRHAQLLIRWHHECWNGQGYPDGLAGEAIPLGARILRAVDSYYALISKRPYRNRYELHDAEQMLADLAGLEFDPLVVKYLLSVLVEERKGHETEYSTPLTLVPPNPPMELGAHASDPPGVNPPGYAFSPEDPLEFAPREAVPPPSQEEMAEPLSELLAEIPETSVESSFSSTSYAWPEPVFASDAAEFARTVAEEPERLPPPPPIAPAIPSFPDSRQKADSMPAATSSTDDPAGRNNPN